MLNQPTSQLKPFKLDCTFRIEKAFGYRWVAGIDEVGRGCIAGPVVAAGVVFSPEIWDESHPFIEAINDSKLLKPEKREELALFIYSKALAVEYCVVSNREVDRVNILRATFRAAREVIKRLQVKIERELELILFDGPHRIPGIKTPQHPIVSGDRISKSIAAASIVAKVHRDRLMRELAGQFPGYGFDQHKGYGTSEHWQAVDQLGPCSLHRKSFLKKMRSIQLGQEAEQQVSDFLEQNSFQIILRNWKTKGAEIDIVALRQNELHFIEVRSRSLALDLNLYFSKLKQQQFQKAVQLFFYKNPNMRSHQFHLSLICVTPDGIEPFWDVYKF